MRYVKWTFWLLLIAAVASVLHYTLPRHDVVRIVGTENRRIDLGENRLFWATAPAVTEGQQEVRDIRFILAIRPNGREMVYRNEDTGWGWPPYFKFNSSNVQARATDLVSNQAAPQWVAVTRYGWRNEFLSSFPNAIGLTPIAGPEEKPFPWIAVGILAVLAGTSLWLFLAIRRFWFGRVEPVLDRAEARADEARLAGRGAIGRFFKRLGF
jgi:hypothetical protein